MNLQNRSFLPLTLAVASVACSSFAATAEVSPSKVATPTGASIATPEFSLQPSVQLPQFVEASAPLTAEKESFSPKPVQLASNLASNTDEAIAAATVPLPGSAETTASGLLTQPIAPTTEAQSANSSSSGGRRVAQDITPGRATRSGSSYFGVGGNIGLLGGSTAVGDGSFAILSKIGLTDRVSFRPAVLFGGDVTFLLPVTYDFSSVGSVGSYSVAPYVGAGFAINTGSDNTFNLLGTLGVDIPLGSQFTANAALNVTFLNDVSFGLLLGLGYNF